MGAVLTMGNNRNFTKLSVVRGEFILLVMWLQKCSSCTSFLAREMRGKNIRALTYL